MTLRKSILLLIGLSMVAALVACSSSSSTPPPPPPVITVSLSTVATPLTVNSQTSVTATTTDTAGVNWSVACASTSGACGSFTAAQTSTGTANTYIAPPFPTTNVVLTATSVTNSAVSASTTPAITIAGATLADGSYVFSLAGEDLNSNFHVAGAFTVAGGLITGGEQNFADILHDRFDGIDPTGSGIAYTADGNLVLTLVTCTAACPSPDTVVGVAGTETLNGTILPLSTTGKSLITEFDTSASASGVLEPQATVPTVAPGPVSYAFVLNGYDTATNHEAVGGIINVDTAGGISGTGSIFDVNDFFSGNEFAGQTFTASTVSVPDAFGQVTFSLNATFFTTLNLAGYIVDPNHIQLVESSDPYAGTLGGVAYTQASTGNFTAASAAGTYVVGLQGFDTSGALQAVTQLALVSGAGVKGFVDYNDIATSSGVTASPDPVTASGYTLDTAGIAGASAGDVTIADVTDTDGTIGYNVQLYLDGNGHALAITMDGTDAVAGAGYTQGTGITTSSFSGSYGLDITGADGTAESELDGAGPVSVAPGAFSGTVDLNWLGNPSPGPTYPGTAVSGTIVTTGAAAANGIFTGTVTGVDVVACITNTSCSNDNFSYYLVDSTGDNIAIETDTNQLTLGFFLQQ